MRSELERRWVVFERVTCMKASPWSSLPECGDLAELLAGHVADIVDCRQWLMVKESQLDLGKHNAFRHKQNGRTLIRDARKTRSGGQKRLLTT